MAVGDWISVAGLVLMGIVIPMVGYFIKAVQKCQIQIAVLIDNEANRKTLCDQHSAWLLRSAQKIEEIAINVAVLRDRGERVDKEHRGERAADGRHEGT